MTYDSNASLRQAQQEVFREMAHAIAVDPPRELLPVIRRRRTYKRCYELAYLYLMEHFDVPGLELVHGTYHGSDGLDIGHAWVEASGGYVWDGTLQRIYDRHLYYAAVEAVPLVRYGPADAAKLCREHGNLGPWDTILQDRYRERSRFRTVEDLRASLPDVKRPIQIPSGEWVMCDCATLADHVRDRPKHPRLIGARVGEQGATFVPSRPKR